MTDWYEYPSNYSNGTSVEGIGDFVSYTSSLTYHWLAIGFLFLIWLFTFGYSMVSGSRKALLTSSFITFCFSIYFIRMHIINPVIVIALLVMTIIGAITSYNEKGL